METLNSWLYVGGAQVKKLGIFAVANLKSVTREEAGYICACKVQVCD